MMKTTCRASAVKQYGEMSTIPRLSAAWSGELQRWWSRLLPPLTRVMPQQQEKHVSELTVVRVVEEGEGGVEEEGKRVVSMFVPTGREDTAPRWHSSSPARPERPQPHLAARCRRSIPTTTMSAPTGISVSHELTSAFSDAVSSRDTRFLKISIQNGLCQSLDCSPRHSSRAC